MISKTLLQTLVSDDKLSQFIQTWESVLAGMKEELPASTMEVLFLMQLRTSKVLKEEIAHYDRVEKGHADKSYEYLVKTLKRYLERKRQERNRHEVERQLRGGGHKDSAAHGVPKGKGKGKKDKRGRTESASGRKKEVLLQVSGGQVPRQGKHVDA